MGAMSKNSQALTAAPCPPLSSAAVSGQRLPAGGAAEALRAHLLPAHHPEERRQHLQDGQGTHTKLKKSDVAINLLRRRHYTNTLLPRTLQTHARYAYTH